jgi:3-phosphoshikimate 1-carboxyvinyltransferase
MSAMVLGQATDEPVMVDDAGFIDTSFPGFIALMNGVGGALAAA